MGEAGRHWPSDAHGGYQYAGSGRRGARSDHHDVQLAAQRSARGVRRHDVKEVNGDTVILDPRAARVSVWGSFNFKLPRRPLAGSTTLRVLYLDSDLQIIATDKGGDYLHPEVFVKPKGFNEQVELRMRKKVDDKGALRIIGEGLMRFIANPLKTRSPFRLRDRVAGVRDAAEDVNDASK